MSPETPLLLSRLLLSVLGTQLFLHYGDRVPTDSPVLLISNHRSFMDAPLLITATNRPVRFACHHYMSRVPVLQDLVAQMGCFPLAELQQRQQSFFQQATQLLQTRQMVGVFPEGAPPMVQATEPCQVGAFERGFAHLALRATVEDLVILPVAIAAVAETCQSVIPLKLLSYFDPSEPLFNQPGWHPLVIYQRVNVLIGHPWRITPSQQQTYQGKEAKALVTELTHRCRAEIQDLLKQGCF
jgi:1-acyl-sn-glycerol-3-phosphate acyltransferase